MQENDLEKELHRISTLRTQNVRGTGSMRDDSAQNTLNETASYLQHLESRVLMQETYDRIKEVRIG